MFDKLRKEKNKIKPEENIIMGAFDGDDIFVGADGVVYGSPQALEKVKEMWGD